MLVFAILAALGLFVVAAIRLPRPLLRRYLAAFGARHGVGVQIGVTVLATLVGALLLACMLRPGHPRAELVDALAVGFLGLSAAIDVYVFSRAGLSLKR